MQFKDAVIKSIQKFYDGNMPENSVGEDFPYTPEYFDDLDVEKTQDQEESDDAKDA